MDCLFKMIEIKKIVSIWIVQPGKGFYKVLITTQKKKKINDIVLQEDLPLGAKYKE